MRSRQSLGLRDLQVEAQIEATCRNKKRAESEGGGGGDVKNSRGVCHVCGSKDHFVKDCPLVAKARALHVVVSETAPTSSVSAENKPSADVAPNYSTPPSVPHANPKRHPTAPALMTTALLASAAAPCAPMRAHFDSAATAHMGPDARFLRDARPSNVGIEVYNNEVVTNNMEGEFISHSAEGDLPNGQRGYTNPLLPTTLISWPQVVFEHPKQDVVLSEKHGSFMQPTSTACPIDLQPRGSTDDNRSARIPEAGALHEASDSPEPHRRRHRAIQVPPHVLRRRHHGA